MNTVDWWLCFISVTAMGIVLAVGDLLPIPLTIQGLLLFAGLVALPFMVHNNWCSWRRRRTQQ